MLLTQPGSLPASPTDPGYRPPALRTVGVDVVLGGIPIVRNADLEILPGEAVAIMGNNGSGKTTLLRATLGLVPHEGLIELFGTPLESFREWRRVGYVPQRSGILVQQATAREVVASGRLASRRPFSPATTADRKAITAALERVGLADRARHPFVRLSGGQQQRVLIARALATGAELMMWDEPLAGVDHHTQALLSEVAAQLKADGVTIVIVLHELGCFEPVIDRAISLAEGRIVADGPLPAERSEGHEVADLKPTTLHRTGLEAPVMEWLALEFMQRALLAALITGVTAPAIGTYLVQRRLSLLGDGLGHLAVAGVGLAFLTNTAPLPVAILVCVIGSVGIELLRESGRASGDVGLAILFYGGLSGGLLLAGLAGQGAGTLSNYLFGSLLTVTTADLWAIAGLGAIVAVVCLGLLPQLFAVSADEPFARTIGLPVRFLNILVVTLAAITVTVSMRTVGLLLVSALMVVPVATANHLITGFRAGLLASMALGAVAALSGAVGSYYLDTAPGSLIVVIAIALFAVSWPLSRLAERRHGRLVDVGSGEPVAPGPEVAEAHPHVHGENCGHRPVLHAGHVDYVHDGHRHAAHGDHYDEH